MLSAPLLLLPAEGAVFPGVSLTTTLSWAAVPGATVYKVEVLWEFFEGNWMIAYLEETTSTSSTFEFRSTVAGRWRVRAFDASHVAGPWSDYRTFRYTE